MTWTEPEPRSVAFRTDWEPDPEELRVVTDYLLHQPERLDETWEEHHELMAWGILQALHVLRGGSVHALPEDEAQRYIAQAHAMGKEIAALNDEIMGYQVRDGYDKGHEHGQAAAVAEVLALRAERDALRAEVATLRGERVACANCSADIAARDALRMRMTSRSGDDRYWCDDNCFGQWARGL